VGPGHHRATTRPSIGRPPPPALPAPGHHVEAFTQAEIDRRERLQKISLVDQGITFTVLRREGRHRADLPLRLRAAHHPGPGVGADRGRPRAARDGAEPVHQRRLPGPEVPQGPRDPARAGPLAPRVQARAAAGDAAAADLHARGRHRHHPRRPRRVPDPGGQLPLPERRVVRAREPQPLHRVFPELFTRLSRAADPRLSRCCWTRCCGRRHAAARTRWPWC